MSHEIRTPLNGVLGMAQVMEASPLAAAQRRNLQTILESGRLLSDIVNDVLDISRAEAGKLELRLAPTDMDGLIDSVVRLYGPMAAEKGLALLVERGPHVDGLRMGDEVRLRQVLGNLLSNAIKFTNEGHVCVRTSSCGEAWLCEVSDTGPGMDAQARDTVFERFIQGHDHPSTTLAGTGLGLAICRDLTRAMGGHIDLVSAPGHGSSFNLHLPLARCEDAPSAASDTEIDFARTGARPARVLVVDDNAANRQVLKALLGAMEAEVTLACDGQEAVRLWTDGVWDIVLMDINMPVMDGLEATRAIRTLEAGRGHAPMPIIAVTASVLSHETARYYEAGMTAVVAKPIELADLASILARFHSADEAAENLAAG